MADSFANRLAQVKLATEVDTADLVKWHVLVKILININRKVTLIKTRQAQVKK